MSEVVEYTGEETEEAYLSWLAKEYPWSVQYPPNSLWKINGKLHQVVGYLLMDEEPGVKIVPLPTPESYKRIMKTARNVRASCLQNCRRQR